MFAKVIRYYELPAQ